MNPVHAFIGLGSNQQHPAQQLDRALQALQQLPHTTLLAQSSYYQSRPLGGLDQPDYLNAVAQLHTGLDALSLLTHLQTIESAQGRQRGERWASRTLDLDLLLYHNAVIDQPQLQVPHHGLRDRNFVVIPLFEIAPDLMLPDGMPLRVLAEQLSTNGLIKR